MELCEVTKLLCNKGNICQWKDSLSYANKSLPTTHQTGLLSRKEQQKLNLQIPSHPINKWLMNWIVGSQKQTYRSWRDYSVFTNACYSFTGQTWFLAPTSEAYNCLYLRSMYASTCVHMHVIVHTRTHTQESKSFSTFLNF